MSERRDRSNPSERVAPSAPADVPDVPAESTAALAPSYLIVEPDRPSADEYARGAALIPSMLDEGVRVWRVPAEPDPSGRFRSAPMSAPGCTSESTGALGSS
jgi:hypothetical protein